LKVPNLTSPTKQRGPHIFLVYVLLELIAVHVLAALWHCLIRRTASRRTW